MKCAASNPSLIVKTKEEERSRMAELYTVLCLYNAMDKCGLDEETAFKLAHGVVNDADSVVRDYTRLNDYKEVLEKEYGLKFPNK